MTIIINSKHIVNHKHKKKTRGQLMLASKGRFRVQSLGRISGRGFPKAQGAGDVI